ncbi:YafY family protein [Variovorax sp. KK3]|uniref:helix-turn-helix transcriptional regulator n=1 Tax=Variovorax sp. KK3 TaxID=1855728 RepID=UPI00097C01CA|nr:YafY family protein [Variovorax sp. KK3]
MSRAERLLSLMQCLRRHRQPVGGAALARELDISLRTLYRDIASLQAQGADIRGEAGVGYVLRPGFTLPPLMFSVTELEALLLGARWVAQRTDSELADDARNALSKIAAVLPADLRQSLDDSTLLIGPAGAGTDGTGGTSNQAHLPVLRRAIRLERKLRIGYLDLKGIESERTIWPFALGFFDQAHVAVAWCELRQEQRHFRVDRMTAVEVQEERYPERRQALLKAWRRKEGIAPTR